jgi:flagellar biosynthesis protein FlhB
MADFAGDKTEQPTPRRLEEAVKKGQFPKSPEVQTVFVLLSALMAIRLMGAEMWRQLLHTMAYVLGHIHQVPVTFNLLPSYGVSAAWTVIECAGPIVLACVIGGLLAGGVQNRFQTASEALSVNWERVNPVAGLKRVFSMQAAVPSGLALLKLATIMVLSYSEIRHILDDPIFYTSVEVARIAEFMAESAFKILLRIGLILVVIAALDYAYKFWKHQRDLMMTKEEVKDESKNSDGNPQIKARQRQRRRAVSQRRMLMEVPKADVVVTNPTHLAIALRYDPKTMKAPRIVAKGSRLNALRIREIAARHQVPIIENKPLARLMFKYGRVDGEVPAQLYAAVAEILAWVYRMNRYKYYALANQVQS